MSTVFLSQDGKVIFYYPSDGLHLQTGDFVVFQEKEYVITRKRFNVDARVIETFIQERS